MLTQDGPAENINDISPIVRFCIYIRQLFVYSLFVSVGLLLSITRYSVINTIYAIGCYCLYKDMAKVTTS